MHGQDLDRQSSYIAAWLSPASYQAISKLTGGLLIIIQAYSYSHLNIVAILRSVQASAWGQGYTARHAEDLHFSAFYIFMHDFV